MSNDPPSEAPRREGDAPTPGGPHGTTRRHLRDSIGGALERRAAQRLHELVEAGLGSGPAHPLTPERASWLRRQALDGLRQCRAYRIAAVPPGDTTP